MNEEEIKERAKFDAAVARCRAGLGCGDYVFKTSTNVDQISKFISESIRPKHIGSAVRTQQGWEVVPARPSTPNPAQEPENKLQFKRK